MSSLKYIVMYDEKFLKNIGVGEFDNLQDAKRHISLLKKQMGNKRFRVRQMELIWPKTVPIDEADENGGADDKV